MSTFSQVLINCDGSEPRQVPRFSQVAPSSATSVTLPQSPGANVVFAVPTGALMFAVGAKVRVYAADAPANWLEGAVASYSGTTLTVTVTACQGTETWTDWHFCHSTLSAEVSSLTDAVARGWAAAAQASADIANAALAAEITNRLAADAAGGGASYRHVQSIPSAEWLVTHNLNKYPPVAVVDSAGTDCIGSVTYLNLQQLLITHAYPFSGEAQC